MLGVGKSASVECRPVPVYEFLSIGVAEEGMPIPPLAA